MRTSTAVLTHAPAGWSTPPAISELPKLTRQVDRAPASRADNRANRRLMAACDARASRGSWAFFFSTVSRILNQPQPPTVSQAFDVDLTDAETCAGWPKMQGDDPLGESTGPGSLSAVTTSAPTRGPNLRALGGVLM